MELLNKLSEQETIEFIKNIDSKKLCFLMMGLSEKDQKQIYSQMSDKAQELIKADISKLESATSSILL